MQRRTVLSAARRAVSLPLHQQQPSVALRPVRYQQLGPWRGPGSWLGISPAHVREQCAHRLKESVDVRWRSECSWLPPVPSALARQQSMT